MSTDTKPPVYVEIYGTRVHAVHAEEPPFAGAEGVTVIEAPAALGVAQGWTYDPTNEALSAPVAPTIDLVAYAAAARFAVETGGIVVQGIRIATDRDSQSLIANAYAGMQASGAASVKFKAASGWIELSAEQVKAIALAVFAHVQACFAAEDGVDAGLNASPPTIATPAQVDAAFAALGT